MPPPAITQATFTEARMENIGSPAQRRWLAGRPTATCEVFVTGNHRLVFKGSAHRVVPPIEETEHGNGRNDFDDLLLAPVLAQIFESLIGDNIGHTLAATAKSRATRSAAVNEG